MGYTRRRRTVLRRRFARHHRRFLALAAALAVLGASAACTGEAPSVQSGHSPVAATPDPAGRAQGTVLQPGKPGEPATTLPPDARDEQAPWNAADAAVGPTLIPHHARALRMGGLARTRAHDRTAAAVARRIHAAQAPEIVGLSAWLQAHGLAGRARQGGMHHKHGMQGMHSMQEMHGM